MPCHRHCHHAQHVNAALQNLSFFLKWTLPSGPREHIHHPAREPAKLQATGRITQRSGHSYAYKIRSCITRTDLNSFYKKAFSAEALLILKIHSYSARSGLKIRVLASQDREPALMFSLGKCEGSRLVGGTRLVVYPHFLTPYSQRTPRAVTPLRAGTPPPLRPAPIQHLFEKGKGARGPGSRASSPARGCLGLWAVWAWEYHEPETPFEPAPLAAPDFWLFPGSFRAPHPKNL